MQALRLLIISILGILLTLAIVRWDRIHLDPEQRARSWNSATTGQALLNFGPWSLLGWGWVTRRWKGLLFGFVLAFAMSWALVQLDEVLEKLLGK
jgi:hypothetical protein